MSWNHIKRLSVQERLDKFRRVDEATGCHIFTGSLTGSGYGQIWFQDRKVQVHRLVLYLAGKLSSVEVLLDSRVGMHKCPNGPDKRCFNLEHLKVGTQSENVKEAR